MASLLTGGTVSFLVQAALSGSASDSKWDVARWDEDLWSGAEPRWFDLGEVEAVQCQLGRDRFLDVPRTATANVVLSNTYGRYNPVVGDTTPLTMRPGRLIRILAETDDGSTTTRRPIFTGSIQSIGETYGSGADNPMSTFMCSGFLTAMARSAPPALEANVGGGELTSDRVERVLNEWPRTISNLGSVQTGDHRMANTDMGGGLIGLVQAAAQAEGSASGFWFNGSGEPVFKRRDWLKNDGRSINIQIQPGSGLPGEAEVLDAVPTWGLGNVINDVQVTRPSGDSYRLQSTLSISLYGTITLQANVQVNNDPDLIEVAEGALEGNEYDRMRLNQITLHAPDTAAAERMFDTAIGDMARVTVTTQHGWGYTVDTHVTGIAYDITADDWIQILRLDDSATDIPPGVRGAFNPTAFDSGFWTGT